MRLDQVRRELAVATAAMRLEPVRRQPGEFELVRLARVKFEPV